jgi:hypothetical protein
LAVTSDPRRIPVTYRECLQLGGNLVSLGGGRHCSCHELRRDPA